MAASWMRTPPKARLSNRASPDALRAGRPPPLAATGAARREVLGRANGRRRAARATAEGAAEGGGQWERPKEATAMPALPACIFGARF